MKTNGRTDATFTRRQFFKAGSFAVIGATALSPAKAFASVGGEMANPQGDVDSLWAAAVADARRNGYPISYNCKDEVKVIPSNKNIDCKLEGKTSISGRQEHISAVAFYTVTDDKKKIVKMRKLTVYATASEVKDKTYDHILADGGRTLIVHCHVVLRSNVLGVSQAYKLYMEYPRSGTGGFMRIEFA